MEDIFGFTWNLRGYLKSCSATFSNWYKPSAFWISFLVLSVLEISDLTVSIEKGACSLESSGPIGEVVLKVDGGEEVTVDVKESKETVDVSKMNMDSDTVRCVVRQKVDLNGIFNIRFGKTYGKYMASENGYVGINGKGILTPKKAGTVKVFGCEKNSGTKKWEAVGEPVTVYIEMPAKVKGNIVSNRHLETMNAL